MLGPMSMREMTVTDVQLFFHVSKSLAERIIVFSAHIGNLFDGIYMYLLFSNIWGKLVWISN